MEAPFDGLLVMAQSRLGGGGGAGVAGVLPYKRLKTKGDMPLDGVALS